MKFTIATALFILLSVVIEPQAQTRSSAIDRYNAAEKVCQKYIESEHWTRAERDCSKALAASRHLPQDHKTQRLNALYDYAFTFHSQSKFDVALSAYKRGFDFALANFPTDKLVLGRAFFLLARANQGMASIKGSYITEAEANYAISDEKLRSGLAEETDPSRKVKFKKYLEDTLVLRLWVARLRRDAALVKELEARLTELKQVEIT